MNNPVAAALASVAFGPEVIVDNLTMIPLLLKDSSTGRLSSTLDYMVLDEALASGVVEIPEVSEQGSVPELKFIDRGLQPVLIVDGEELFGAKQNRIVNLTILVAPNSEVTINRDRHRSHALGAAGRELCPRCGRERPRPRSPAACLNAGHGLARGDRISDQGEV